MKIRLEIGPDTDVEVEEDKDGNIKAIVFKPLFASQKAPATIAYGVTESEQGTVLDRFSLSVSGATGNMKKNSRRETVKAFADLSDTERQTAGDDDD